MRERNILSESFELGGNTFFSLARYAGRGQAGATRAGEGLPVTWLNVALTPTSPGVPGESAIS